MSCWYRKLIIRGKFISKLQVLITITSNFRMAEHVDVKYFPMLEYEKEHIEASLINLPENGTSILVKYCPSKYNSHKEQLIQYFRILG